MSIAAMTAMDIAEVTSQIPAECAPERRRRGVLVPRRRPGRPTWPHRTRRYDAGVRSAQGRVMTGPEGISDTPQFPPFRTRSLPFRRLIPFGATRILTCGQWRENPNPRRTGDG